MRGSAVYKPEVKKTMDPRWRGVGCVMVVFIFALSFVLSLWLITGLTSTSNNKLESAGEFLESFLQIMGFASTSPDYHIDVPRQLAFVPSALRGMRSQFRAQFPWFGIYEYMVPTFVATVMSVLFYGVISMVYAFLRGDINDPRDARNYQAPGRRKRNVRKCR